jgi:hypothetical protein
VLVHGVRRGLCTGAIGYLACIRDSTGQASTLKLPLVGTELCPALDGRDCGLRSPWPVNGRPDRLSKPFRRFGGRGVLVVEMSP